MFDFSKCASQIGGWLTPQEGKFLFNVAKGLPKSGKIIEIGSWKGRSTICFGMGAKEGNGATIYAIDPHTGSSEHIKRFGKVDTYSEFLVNINNAGVKTFVVPVRDISENVAKDFDEKVDFVLVDGAHEYEFVKKDYELWFPKLKTNRLIAFHDCWHAIGVHCLTARVLLTSEKVRHPRLLDTLTIMEKVEGIPFWERVNNAIFVIYRLFFGWIGTIKMDYFGGTMLK